VMIINIDSFRRDENIINQETDKMSGRKPIDFVQATKPIVIMDEPQNMETEKSVEAIKSLNPLCTLRYSATHKNHYNLVYRLSPVDAYDKRLVKRIEVASVKEENSLNDAYIKVLSIKPQKTQIKATLEIEKSTKKGTKKVKISINTKGEYDLYELSNKREVYEGYSISLINAEKGFIEFTNGEKVYEGKPKGEMNDEIQKYQIRETIKEHLDKEKKLKNHGIKVLSLFFIDRVNNYRDYEADDEKGKFAKWFEEIYKELAKSEFRDLDLLPAEKVHEGYFSQDNKGRLRDSSSGDAQYDEPTYDLIMKNKERLLSFDEPIKFIFSHSALREGWDNPNVFQICTLNETSSEMKKRQEIGRGLRIPVNQDGERIFNDNFNILTVVANESYEDFAKALQSEMKESGYDFGENRIKRRSRRKTLKLKKGWKLDKEFKELWDKINLKTRYQVELDSNKLIENVSKHLNKSLKVNSPKIKIEKGSIEINKKGIEGRIKKSGTEKVESSAVPIPNVIKHLSDGTNLTKRTLLEILIKSGKLSEALINPQQFIDMCLEEINKELQQMMVDGIKYEKVGNKYALSLFESEELESYLDNMYKVEDQEKTLFNYVIYDSEIEHDFAKDLESMEKVKFYIKLPNWFRIDTPLGSYNPDWGVVFNGDKRMYFVSE
ncbi:MAG: DEAD/DEAH box helicase, partial [Candidatus Paceibacterota bacterium]